jgi:hypothetical protein
MKISSTLRMLAAAGAFAIASQAGAAVLQVSTSGILTGATGVDVGGTLYNVKFADGSCNSLFNGCMSSAFAFNTFADVVLAGNALLDQVYIDSSAGQFDSISSNILGCTAPTQCVTAIPYSRNESSAITLWVISSSSSDYVLYGSQTFGTAYDTTNHPAIHFAIFELANPTVDVPEPTSTALFGLALAGLAFTRRRKA